jgi:hypothetical protein
MTHSCWRYLRVIMCIRSHMEHVQKRTHLPWHYNPSWCLLSNPESLLPLTKRHRNYAAIVCDSLLQYTRMYVCVCVSVCVCHCVSVFVRSLACHNWQATKLCRNYLRICCFQPLLCVCVCARAWGRVNFLFVFMNPESRLSLASCYQQRCNCLQVADSM